MIRQVIVASVVAFAACGGAQAKSSQNEARLSRWVSAHLEEEIAFIEKTVNINSGTMNLEGVTEVGKLYHKAFEELGMEVRWHPLPEDMKRAGHLIATTPDTGRKRIVLIGHLDTVFPKDSSFQRFERKGDRAVGPGVVDMKGGNAVIVYALKALHETGLLKQVAVTVILTGDEEAPGDPLALTRKPLIDAVKVADAALGFEALVNHHDTATIARRGYIGWSLSVTGKAGHSSQIFSDEYGFGAIYEAARIVNGIRMAVAGHESLTMSIGRMAGGSAIENKEGESRSIVFGKANVIPKTVEVSGEMRALYPKDAAATQKEITELVAKSLPGSSATIRFIQGYPAMAPTEANKGLLALLSEINRDMGRGEMEAVDPMKRGAADISFAAPLGPAIGGLGPFGGGDHSDEEWLDLTSVPVATERAARFIYRLARQPKAQILKAPESS